MFSKSKPKPKMVDRTRAWKNWGDPSRVKKNLPGPITTVTTTPPISTHSLQWSPIISNQVKDRSTSYLLRVKSNKLGLGQVRAHLYKLVITCILANKFNSLHYRLLRSACKDYHFHFSKQELAKQMQKSLANIME